MIQSILSCCIYLYGSLLHIHGFGVEVSWYYKEKSAARAQADQVCERMRVGLYSYVNDSERSVLLHVLYGSPSYTLVNGFGEEVSW